MEDYGPLLIPGIDRDEHEGNQNPIVALEQDGDMYTGNSKLRYSTKRMEMNPQIPILARVKKEPVIHHFNDTKPEIPEVDIYHHMEEDSKPRKWGGIQGKGRKIGEVPKIEEKLVRTVGTRFNPTKWVPYIQSGIKNILNPFLGTMFMPTHIMAVPTHGLTEAPIVHTNPKLFTPFRQNEGQEKLRAYHAMCDAWNEMQNPDPTTRLWKVNKILKVSNKEVKDGKRSIFYKAQF